MAYWITRTPASGATAAWWSGGLVVWWSGCYNMISAHEFRPCSGHVIAMPWPVCRVNRHKFMRGKSGIGCELLPVQCARRQMSTVCLCRTRSAASVVGINRCMHHICKCCELYPRESHFLVSSAASHFLVSEQGPHTPRLPSILNLVPSSFASIDLH
jgi:hypothetical protein